MMGIVGCGCGEVVRLEFEAGVGTPAYYRSWCARCGAELEGMVELAPEVEAAATSTVCYAPLPELEKSTS